MKLQHGAEELMSWRKRGLNVRSKIGDPNKFSGSNLCDHLK